MKISWGIKITVLYIGFVMLILCMVSMAVHQKVELVSTDYYAQELKYQDKINKVNHTHELKEQLIWNVKTGTLTLKFPEQFKSQKITGSVYFFRPSDAAMDKTIPIPTDTSSIKNIVTDQLKKGLYKIEVSWEVNKEKYYNEGIIQIN
jgi:hypothetical protein